MVVGQQSCYCGSVQFSKFSLVTGMLRGLKCTKADYEKSSIICIYFCLAFGEQVVAGDW
jgi:hypothetical protein